MTNDERDERIETLTDAIAETNRNVNALAGQVAELGRDISVLVEAIADTNRNVGTLAGDAAGQRVDLSSLTQLVRLHLVADHDYPDLGDDGSDQ